MSALSTVPEWILVRESARAALDALGTGREGTENVRAWTDDPARPRPGFRGNHEEDYHQWQEDSAARREAFRAARDSAAVKTRQELRDLYIAELRARGQVVLPQEFVDVELDIMSGHPLRALRRMVSFKRDRNSASGL